MKTLNVKLVLSAVGIAALLTGPAFAKKAPRANQDTQTTVSQTIPGYAADGTTVAIPDPDRR